MAGSFYWMQKNKHWKRATIFAIHSFKPQVAESSAFGTLGVRIRETQVFGEVLKTKTHSQQHASFKKATPPFIKPHLIGIQRALDPLNLPPPPPQCLSLMTKHLCLWAFRDHSYSNYNTIKFTIIFKKTFLETFKFCDIASCTQRIEKDEEVTMETNMDPSTFSGKCSNLVAQFCQRTL